MFAGNSCRFRFSRVNQNDFAAAFFYVFEAIYDIGRGHQTTVRGERICAENQKIIRAVNIGNRHKERMTEHRPRGEMMRQLVNRSRRKVVLSSLTLSKFRRY